MFVYRVYESYHYDDESGTKEYGTFSTLELAKARVAKMWEFNKYPSEGFEDYENGSRTVDSGWDYCTIHVEEIEVDKEINGDNVGFT